MLESELANSNAVEQKSKIRTRYKGIDPSLLKVIPARSVAGLYDDDVHRRVAVYARVSTGDSRQTTSYELQKTYYEDYVGRHPNWELVSIYADEGISGTSLKHRDAFNSMIADCHAGKIDMIITKSVSRFARNIMDCIGTVNNLKLRSQPIGVLFENEQIYTLNPQSEMSLSFTAAMAQEESHTKSTSMNASYEMRFSHGIFLTPPLLGYDQDENGHLVINEEEAKTVRLIFFMYLYGYSTQQIAEQLMELARPTKKGNLTWSSSTVLSVLQNERHCGAVLARKTYTPNYLDHKAKRNRGDRNQYRHDSDHDAIITPADFVAVQRKISNSKYGGNGIPELHVIPNGALKKFVTVNPRWASFRAEDYLAAAAKVTDSEPSEEEIAINVQIGDPDFRGFEVARKQFFSAAQKINVTFSIDGVKFSTDALKKINSPEYVELLIQPERKLLAVRKCSKDTRTGVKWVSGASGKLCPKIVPGAAFLPTIYELLGWSQNYRYRVDGVRRQKDEEAILLFDLRETEILIPTEQLDAVLEQHGIQNENFSPLQMPGNKRTVVAYPSNWANNFGSEYYQQAHGADVAAIDHEGMWDIFAPGSIYTGSEPQCSPREQLDNGIRQLLNGFKEEVC